MAPQERFEGEEDLTRAPVSSEELRLVLQDLGSDCFEEQSCPELPDDHVTAEAISEACGVSIGDVYEAIARVRRQEVRERVSRILNELEEPAYRVERPGPGPTDPLLTHYGFRRENVINNILDKLPRPGPRQSAPAKSKPEKDSPVTVAVSWILFSGIAALVLYSLYLVVTR